MYACVDAVMYPCVFQVNDQNLERWSHDTAALALKNAGEAVTLKVVYKPKGGRGSREMGGGSN